MKIALLSPFYPYRGGIAQFSDRLYQELVKEHEVKVFSYSKLYPDFLFPGKTQFVPDTYLCQNLPSERILSSTNLLSHHKTAQSINQYAPDVLIVAYWMPFFAFALSRVCKRLDKNIQVIGLVHNAIPHEKSVGDIWLAKRFFKYCDAFVCMSQQVKTDLMKMGMKAPVLALEHPIYDHYPEKVEKELACEKLGIDKTKKTILFFGLIRSYKGLDLLIEAMSELDDSYQLLIAGECYGSFTPYQQLIDLSPNKKNIKAWNQYIPDDSVAYYFSAADVLILPYRSATQSGVVAMAYQMETPIIATDVGALGDTVKTPNIGLVVTDVTSSCIAQGIKDFFHTDDRSMYYQNLEKEKKRLSWNNFAKALVPFISEEKRI